jgi:DNA-directed RNA polymerase specialized sigma24 family protein
MSNFAGLSPAALPPSDADLAAASSSGDTVAYATLSRRHVTSARILARHLTSRRAEANDVVAEAFAEVHDVLRRGDGLDSAFRPYLLAAVRRVAENRHQPARRQVTDEPESCLVVAGPDRAVIARAFASLHGRWQAVLWQTEIEGARPAEAARLLGLTAAGAAVLAYRAREGLRQAYLQTYLSDGPRDECRPVAAGLGAYARGLAAQDTAESAAHLNQCADCREVLAELGDVNVSLRSSVAPLILGSATAGYLAAASRSSRSSRSSRPARPAGSPGLVGSMGLTGLLGLADDWVTSRMLWFRHSPEGQQAAAAGIAVAAVAVMVAASLTAVTMTLTARPGAMADDAPAHQSQPPAAAAAPAASPSFLDSATARALTEPASMTSGVTEPAPATSASTAPAQTAPAQRAPAQTAPAQTAPAPTLPASTAPATKAVSTAPATKAPRPRVSSSAHAPSPVAVRPAQLGTRIDLVGALPRGATGIVSFTVTNSSPVVAARLKANVTLPPRVSYLAAGAPGRAAAAGHGGWRCRPSAHGASCTHGPLAAGTSSTSYLPVAVAADAPAGGAPAISVGDGGRLVRARGAAGVTAAGFPAQFAASGRYAVVTVGSRLAGVSLAGSGSAPLARIGSANLALPGRVVWAGLYWAWTAGSQQEAIELRGPGGHYQRIAGTAAATASLGVRGRPKVAVRQAFADVTGLVARYGAGSWRAAAAGPVRSSARRGGAGRGGAGRGGAGRHSAGAGYLGWTLVAVVADNTAPVGQVMVLGGVRPVDAADPHFSASLGGLTAGRAVRVKAVRWTAAGPQESAFTRLSVGRHAVSFTAGAAPYLMGVITATDSRERFRP